MIKIIIFIGIFLASKLWGQSPATYSVKYSREDLSPKNFTLEEKGIYKTGSQFLKSIVISIRNDSNEKNRKLNQMLDHQFREREINRGYHLMFIASQSSNGNQNIGFQEWKKFYSDEFIYFSQANFKKEIPFFKSFDDGFSIDLNLKKSEQNSLRKNKKYSLELLKISSNQHDPYLFAAISSSENDLKYASKADVSWGISAVESDELQMRSLFNNHQEERYFDYLSLFDFSGKVRPLWSGFNNGNPELGYQFLLLQKDKYYEFGYKNFQNKKELHHLFLVPIGEKNKLLSRFDENLNRTEWEWEHCQSYARNLPILSFVRLEKDQRSIYRIKSKQNNSDILFEIISFKNFDGLFHYQKKQIESLQLTYNRNF